MKLPYTEAYQLGILNPSEYLGTGRNKNHWQLNKEHLDALELSKEELVQMWEEGTPVNG